MSRVSGKFPSSDSKAKPSQPRKSGKRSFRVTPEHPYGDHGGTSYAVEAGYKPFVKRQGHIFDVFPRPSSYEGTIVGSHGEIDYSYPTAYMPVGFKTNVLRHDLSLAERILGWDYAANKRLGDPTRTVGGYNPSKRPPMGFTFPNHQELIKDENVRAWTQFANLFGIRYHRDRYYKFPEGLLGRFDKRNGMYYPTPGNPFRFPQRGVQQYKLLKIVGAISHKRSEASRIRRAARRGVSMVIKPLCISDVLGPRRLHPAREQRFLDRTERSKMTLAVLDARNRCRHAPELVVKAIRKIFSNEKVLEVLHPPGSTPVPEMPITLRHTVYKPPHKRYFDALKRRDALAAKAKLIELYPSEEHDHLDLNPGTIPRMGEKAFDKASSSSSSFLGMRKVHFNGRKFVTKGKRKA